MKYHSKMYAHIGSYIFEIYLYSKHKSLQISSKQRVLLVP